MLILTLTIPSVFCWSLFYSTLRKRCKDRTPEFSNRIVTFCHGVIMASVGSTGCFINGWAFSKDNQPSAATQVALLITSLGYFLFDLVWCLYYRSESNLMIAHHVYSCFAMSRILLKGVAANQATCALGLMEVTNPILQLRWFLRTLGYQKTVVFTCVELCFVVTFVGMRLILGTIITFEVLIGRQDWEFKLLAVLINMVSWGFMIQMYLYMRRKYLDKPLEASSSDISTQTR